MPNQQDIFFRLCTSSKGIPQRHIRNASCTIEMTFSMVAQIFQNPSEKSSRLPKGRTSLAMPKVLSDFAMPKGEAEWFVGLLEARGSFKQGGGDKKRCEITLDVSEYQTLAYVKRLFHGTIKPLPGTYDVCWAVERPPGLDKVLGVLPSILVTKALWSQYQALWMQEHHVLLAPCNPDPVFSVDALASRLKAVVSPNRVSKNTGWFSGFFCGLGTLTIEGTTTTMAVAFEEQEVLQGVQKAFGGSLRRSSSPGNILGAQSWLWEIADEAGIQSLTRYFHQWPLHNPVKQAKLQSFLRFRRYLALGYHRDPAQTRRLDHFVKLFRRVPCRRGELKPGHTVLHKGATLHPGTKHKKKRESI